MLQYQRHRRHGTFARMNFSSFLLTAGFRVRRAAAAVRLQPVDASARLRGYVFQELHCLTWPNKIPRRAAKPARVANANDLCSGISSFSVRGWSF
jgi:hypothetical protein